MKYSIKGIASAGLLALIISLASSPVAQATTSIINGTNLIFNSSLELELGGLTPGTEHDQILATGFVAVGGRLDIVLINAWEPRINDVYTLILAQQIVSQGAQNQLIAPRFAEVNLPDLPPNLKFLLKFISDPTGQQDSLALQVVAVPLPAAGWMLGSALLGLLARRRRNASAST